MRATAIDQSLVALAHPARREIVRLCATTERSVGEMGELLRLRQPSTSQHLRILRDAGIVTVRRDGNRRLYRVDLARLAEITAALDGLWSTRLPELKRIAERKARAGKTDTGR
jgi:DNA-binding transcriptional ArsR family regulator